MDKNRFPAGAQHPVDKTPGQNDLDDRHQAWFDHLPRMSADCLQRYHRPLVTVSYAQSVDGSIASRNREQLLLSSRQSMVLTHRIRAACDAIVIGINTLLVDNPRLTVRLTEGPDPRPVVLDSHLRTPMHARLLERTDHACWLACTESHDPTRAGALERRGARVVQCRSDRRGRVDLPDLLHRLGEQGIGSIMVEGGSQVITSFIEHRLVDQMVITIAPSLVGGLPVLDWQAGNNGSRLQLEPMSFQACGPDIILWAQPQWQDL